MLCVALAQRPSSDVTAALREDRDEPVDTGSKRNVSSQPAASWHAHRHVQYIFNTTSKLDDVAFGESKYFINKLFRKYGTPNMLPFPGLEKLMKNLGMITNNEITETMEGQLGQNINSKENPTASKKRRSSIHTHSDHSEVSDSFSMSCFNVLFLVCHTFRSCSQIMIFLKRLFLVYLTSLNTGTVVEQMTQ